MYQGAKTGKQANIGQLATLVRMSDGIPPERAGVRKAISKAQARVAGRVSTTVTLQAMRRAGAELVSLYSAGLDGAEGLARRALRKDPAGAHPGAGTRQG